MTKIESIKIKGYKNIESAELKLNNFNVIIGPNNSGKSNFIQIIKFLNYVINSSLDDVEKSFSSGFGSTTFKEIVPSALLFQVANDKDSERTGLIEFELTFSNTQTNRIFNYYLVIEWNSTIINNNLSIKHERLDVKESNKPGKAIDIFNRTDEDVKYGTDFTKMDVVKTVPNYFSVIRVLKIISEVKDDYKDAINSLTEIIKTPIFYFSHIELMRTDKERVDAFQGRIVSFELEEEIMALEKSEKWDIFKNAINDILNIEDATVYDYRGDKENTNIPLYKFLYFIHNGTVKTLGQFSDGTILVVALITKIINSKSDLFLIEEPENSIHPKALIDLIAFIKSYSETVQFIITSHSIPLLNKTKLEEIVVSCINDNGFCNFYNVNSKRELKNRFKKSRVNFSDELFFSINDENEFE
jgi:predicted ATPase